jgi:uroporphyrinogen-III decarboxylase
MSTACEQAVPPTVHNIQHDVPPENIMAMREAVMEYGTY